MALTQPAPAAATIRHRLTGPVLTVGGLGLATLALHVRDPHVPGSWGYCPSRVIFGVYCPGCGGLRAVNNLSNGDLLGAASSNLLFVSLIPVVIFFIGRWFWDAYHGISRPHRWTESPWVWTTLGVVMLAFTIARNVPAGAWLAP